MASGVNIRPATSQLIVYVREEVMMLRALVLISAIVFFREFLLRPARRSPTAHLSLYEFAGWTALGRAS